MGTPALLGSIAIVLLGKGFDYWNTLKAKQDHDFTIDRTRSRQLPRVVGSTVRVVGGGSSYTFTGIGGGPIDIGMSNLSAYRMYITEKHEVLINGEIHDRQRAVVARIRDSKLDVAFVLGYDSNSDEDGLEVIAPDKKPILQVNGGGDRQVLRIEYVAYMWKPAIHVALESVIGNENGNYSLHPVDPKAPEGPEGRLPHPLMFRYPSPQSPGVRVNSQASR